MTNTDYQMKTYRYGCPHWADLDAVAMEQLHLAHQFRNELVAIDLAHQEKVKEIWVKHPEVAEADTAVATAEDAVTPILDKIKDARKRYGTTVTPKLGDDLKVIKAAVREAKAKRRAVKAAAGPVMQQAFSAAMFDRNGDHKRTYQAYIAKGLYWPTGNFVLRHHKDAVTAIAKKRARGLPADLRFHRWDASGTIAIQIQRQADDPVPSPAALAAGTTGKWANVAQLGPYPSTPASGPHTGDIMSIIAPDSYAPKWTKGELTMRVRSALYGGDHHLSIPVKLHRPIDPEAEIKEILVTRRRIAGGHRLGVEVVCRVPQVAPVTAGATVAVRLSWREIKGTGLNVAMIAATAPLPPVPADLARPGEPVVVMSDDPRRANVVCPASWVWPLERDATIRSQRDDARDVIKAEMVAAMQATPALGQQASDYHADRAEQITAADVARWRSPGKLARLARAWPEDHPLHGRLQEWLARDRHLWEFEAHERDQTIARRQDAYRKVAAWLCQGAQTVIMQDIPLDQMKLVPKPGTEDTRMARKGRAQLQAASPGSLRAAIEGAAGLRGIPVKSFRETEAGTEVTADGKTTTMSQDKANELLNASTAAS